jgi:antitoxin CptB
MADDLDTRRRRALYRAAHRGTKEMDWLLGRYAEALVPAMSEADLTRFERFLALPDPELQAWILDPGTIAGLEFSELVTALRRFHDLAPRPAAEDTR